MTEPWEVVVEEVTQAAAEVARARWPGKVSGSPSDWVQAYAVGEVKYIGELPPDMSTVMLMGFLADLIDELGSYAERWKLSLASPQVHTFPCWSDEDGNYSNFPPRTDETRPPSFIQMHVSAAFPLSEIGEGGRAGLISMN